MSDKYILATRHMILWQYKHTEKYLRYKYQLLDCSHSSANMDKKSDSIAKFLFGDITKELEVELKEFGMEVLYRDKKVRLS